MADVQTENGYTKIADELLEVIPKFKFNGTQLRIIMVVWRYTYGFGRKDHEMSLSFFMKATGLGKTQLDRELKTLIERNVLTVTEESTYTKSRKLSFNKHYDAWTIERADSQHKNGQSAKTLTVSKKAEEQSVKTLTVSKKAEEQSAKTLTQTVSKFADQDIHSFINNSIDNTTTTIGPRTIDDAYVKVFNTGQMGSLFLEFVHDYKKKGFTDQFLIEVLLEAAESSATKPSLRYIRSIAEEWERKGIYTRAEARKRRVTLARPRTSVAGDDFDYNSLSL